MKGWWLPHSVRVRLTLWYTGALAIVLALYAGGVLVFLRHNLSTELDHRLHDDFEVAEQMLERTADGGVRWRDNDHHEEEEAGDELPKLRNESSGAVRRDGAARSSVSAR